MAHVDQRKKELVKDVYHWARLGVRLADFNKGGIHVQNGVAAYVVVDVKAKQDLDPSLVELKKLVAEKKIEVFS
ncbi:MAG: hypothetical protein Q8850_02640 [Candidatus Phytoplasma australasiaticum]|nr:hypothetical protein [Candidatus Phytoplasma australasiaticum]